MYSINFSLKPFKIKQFAELVCFISFPPPPTSIKNHFTFGLTLSIYSFNNQSNVLSLCLNPFTIEKSEITITLSAFVYDSNNNSSITHPN